MRDKFILCIFQNNKIKNKKKNNKTFFLIGSIKENDPKDTKNGCIEKSGLQVTVGVCQGNENATKQNFYKIYQSIPLKNFYENFYKTGP